VVTNVRQRFVLTGRALVASARNRNLLRVQLSFGTSWTAEWAFVVALGVVAYRDGGATTVGLVAFLRMAPPALFAPISSALADRFRRDRVLLCASLARALAIAAATVLLAAGASPVATYALAVVASCAFIVYRPAHSALMPVLCTTPLELMSATMVRGFLDSLSTLVGPAVAAILLSVANAAWAFGFAAALSVLSAVLLINLSYEVPPRLTSAPRLNRFLADAGEGFRALVADSQPRLLVGLALAQTFTRGCLNVLLVVVSFDLLATGATGVGVLTAAVGAGAVIGSVGALTVVTGRRLAAIQGIGVALWGLPLALSGAFPYGPVVLGLMCFIGVGNALVDIGLFTLLARLVPEAVLGRAFGALESLIAFTVAMGSLITPLAIHLLGLRGALLLLGLLAPAGVALAWPRLRAIDASVVHRDAEIAILNRVGVLQPLPMPAIENLAVRAGHMLVPAGEDVVQQGDVGDRFYVIDDGEADVIGDGHLVRTMGPGGCFGEIALLRNTPRTATVRARTELRLVTLERLDFLSRSRGIRRAPSKLRASRASGSTRSRPRRLPRHRSNSRIEQRKRRIAPHGRC
jgi:MFS family permease